MLFIKTCMFVDKYYILIYYLQHSMMALLCACFNHVMSTLILSHTKPKMELSCQHIDIREEKTTFRLSVNSHHPSNVFCFINDLNNMLQAFEGCAFSQLHTLSKAISSLSSFIVIKVMWNVKGWNVGLQQQPQKLAKSSFT